MKKLSNYLLTDSIRGIGNKRCCSICWEISTNDKGYLVYKHLTQKFGKKNVFKDINKTEKDSPFNFKKNK